MIRSSRGSSRAALVAVALVLLVAGWWLQAPNPTPSSSTRTAETEAPRNEASAPASTDARTDYNLVADEARGGHTLARHVGRTDNQLRERLAREPGISAASTYTDRAVAERTVARTLAQHARRVESWLARDGQRPNLALDYRGPAGDVIGRTLERGRSAPVPSTNAVVVLRWDGYRGFYVLTSYPEARQ